MFSTISAGHKAKMFAWVDSSQQTATIRQPAERAASTNAVNKLFGGTTYEVGTGSEATVSVMPHSGKIPGDFAYPNPQKGAAPLGMLATSDVVLLVKLEDVLLDSTQSHGRTLFDTARDVVHAGGVFKVTGTFRSGLAPLGPYLLWVGLEYVSAYVPPVVAPPAPSIPGYQVSIEGSPTLVAKAMQLAADDSLVLGCENDGAMYRSTDNGHNWSFIQSLGAGKRVTWILKLANNNLLLGTRDSTDNLWRSTDNGASWVNETGIVGTYFREESVMQIPSGRLVAGCHNGHCFTSDDNGATWTDRGAVGTAAIGYSIARAADGTLVMGSNEAPTGKIYYSSDSGVSWQAATTPATVVGSIMNIQKMPDDTLLATGGIPNVVWRSTDNGLNWSEVTAGHNTLWLTMYLVPTTGTVLSMGTAENGAVAVYRSTDSGLNWTPDPTQLHNDATLQLTTTGSENGRQFLETADGAILAILTGAEPVWRNTTDGTNWINPIT